MRAANDRRAAGPRTGTPGRIIAHRGASGAAPENTLAAVREAARQGADWVEFDVSLLGDATPVVIHDATLTRTTDHRGRLARLAAADLAAIDAGSWFAPAFAGEPLPVLAAMLDLLAELGLSANLEMKPHGRRPEPIAEVVAAALAARPWAARRVLVSSFDSPALAALRRLMPAQPLALLVERPLRDWRARLEGLEAAGLHLNALRASPAFVERVRAAGFDVRIYTVNDPAAVVELREAGLTGVITDHPGRFLGDPAWAAWARDHAA